MEWSMNRLPTDHHTVLRRLTVFAGHFDLPAAAAVAGPIDHVEKIVRTLARDALLHIERTGASRLHFRMLRTVRDLASEGLRTNELADTQALHRRWFAGRRRQASVDLVDDVRDNPDDYLEALRTALDSRDDGTLTDLTLAMAEYWRHTGGQVVGLKWIGRVLDSDVLDARAQARVRVQRAALALHHFPDLVLPDTEAAIAVLANHPDDPLLVLAHVVSAVELSSRGQWQGSVRQIDTAVRFARPAAGDPLLRALSAQANVHAVIGDVAGASDAIAEVQSLIDELTPPATRITVHTNIGLAMLNLDRPADALHLLDEVRPDVSTVAGRRPPDFFLLCQGWAELGMGKAPDALDSFFAGVPAHAPPVADRQGAETFLGVGCALAALGHPDAATTLTDALELTDRVRLIVPPALNRRVSAAVRQLGSPAAGMRSNESTARLLGRLQRTLADVVEQLPAAHPVIA
jgi:hypothetical protein